MNQPKYYRLLETEEESQIGDLWVTRQFPQSNPMEQPEYEDLCLRPVTLSQVGWLPIGEKNDWEPGTLFARKDMCGLISTDMVGNYRGESDTHYLPPLPVLDGVKEEDLIYPLRSVKEVKQLVAKQEARISELESENKKLIEFNRECQLIIGF